jgi:DNA-binding response OmpR family regulator
MSDLLRRRGYEVMTAETGEAALALIHQRPFDLLLLDLKMPGLSGIDVARRARERQPDVAIMILTGHGSLDSALDGMHIGVFDYMLKTSSPRDVLDRVAAAIGKQQEERRQSQLMTTLHSVVGELGGASPQPQAPAAENWMAVGDLQISTWNQTVRRGAQTLNLTPTEFRILACLAQQAGQVMTYQQIVGCAQGYDAEPVEAAELVKPHMYHLRQKLELDPANPRYILTVRGTGYMLAARPGD